MRRRIPDRPPPAAGGPILRQKSLSDVRSDAAEQAMTIGGSYITR
ncbi:DUF1659 domain-containing protein [Desulfosporosinus fructosivorans]|uniref:DUF1659 domain-containing protein n=1 Tax=Desulfosporosinus fructosivorans TaxID=2018669 RepID=A0A4Z0R8G9_9FIRM|nr:DUF1659 domain-containing protein [Desulfosporosinus fructosivorans]